MYLSSSIERGITNHQNQLIHCSLQELYSVDKIACTCACSSAAAAARALSGAIHRNNLVTSSTSTSRTRSPNYAGKAAEAEGSSSAPSSSVVPTAPQAQDHEVTGESPEASPGDTHDAAALSSGHEYFMIDADLVGLLALKYERNK